MSSEFEGRDKLIQFYPLTDAAKVIFKLTAPAGVTLMPRQYHNYFRKPRIQSDS